MTVKKKVAKKKAARASAAPKAHAPIKSFTPPKGYETVKLSEEFATNHDFEVDPTLEGVVLTVKTVEVGKGKKTQDMRVMIVDTPAGERSVWESKKLESLFDNPPLGHGIYIQYLGRVPVKGRKQGMHDYAVAVSPEAVQKVAAPKKKKTPF